MNKVINFEIDKAEIVEENPESQFATAKMILFSSGLNRHNMTCTEEVLKETAESAYEKPIIFEVDRLFRDFGSHNPDKTVPAGFIVPGSAEFIQQPDGRLSLQVLGKIWKRYSGRFLDIFKENGRTNSKLSVEMELVDSEPLTDGVVEMKSFIYAAACILGDMVTEASPGANIQMLSFSDEKKEYEKALREEFSSIYQELNMKIPTAIKKSVEKGMALHKEHGKGGTSVSLSLGRFLLKNELATSEKIKHVKKVLSSKKFKDMEKEPPSDAYVDWLLCGGNYGLKWASDLCEKIQEIEEKQMAYFGEMVGFPYINIKDINPALKGIEPPINLEQANHIAKVADSIGADKSGWGIAIDQFKKTHVVKDGKWVKKEGSMEEEKKEEMAAEMPEEEKFEEEKPEKKEEEKFEKKEEEEKEEEEEKSEESEEEDDKEEMSLDQNLDVKAILSMLENETERYGEIVSEFSKETPDFSKVCSEMYAVMCKMSEKVSKMEAENKAYMEENEGLKQFKADINLGKFNFEVESTMKEIENTVEMPDEEKRALVEASKNYSLDTIDAWKNAVKAKAFGFAVKKKEAVEEKRFALPWAAKEVNVKKSIWD